MSVVRFRPRPPEFTKADKHLGESPAQETGRGFSTIWPHIYKRCIMGQRERLKRQRFFASHPLCCFCGGESRAVEIDHVPARHLFRSREWPESYEFPACAACNRASSMDELVMGWIVRIQLSNLSPIDEAEMVSSLTKLNARRPEWVQQMKEFGRVETRRALREQGLANLNLGSGEIYMVAVPEPFAEAMERYGEKLGRALYYLHTSRIVPSSGHVTVSALTNAQFMSANFPHESFSVLNVRPPVSRGNRDLSGLFAYRYATTNDQPGAAFLVQFRESTALLILVNESKVAYDAARARRLIFNAGGSPVPLSAA